MKLVRVINGNAVDFEIDVGFRHRTTQRFRLRNYDVPEIHGPRAGVERHLGLAAKHRLQQVLESDEIKGIEITSYKGNVFGRYLCDVKLLLQVNEATRSWFDLVTWLVREGWGVHRHPDQGHHEFDANAYPIRVGVEPDEGGADR